MGRTSFQNPPSSQTDGLRKIAQRGLVQGTTWTIDNLTPGQTYYWSVQAIDTALAGSPFAAEASVTPLFTDISAALAGVSYSSVAWGDYDNDGDLDILLTGQISSGSISRVYQNISGTFSDITAGLIGVNRSSVAWGDYDNDGDLDILLTGYDSSFNRISRVYQNSGGTFSDISAGLTGVGTSSAAWGDYDNDGDLDILLTGKDDSSNRISIIYENVNGSFSDISAGLIGVYQSSVAWGDYDNDGDLDVLLTGFSDIGRISRVYQNTGGTFSDISTPLTTVFIGSAAWGDYDNDGDLDILLTGAGSGLNPVSHVYRNTSGTFSDISATLTGVRYGAVAWGDYDNDGDLDILLTGYDPASADRISRVYENTSGTFSDISAGLTGVFRSSAAWGDYDNDGDLDILLTGRGSGFNRISQVYENNGTTFNSVPNAPSSLSATINSGTSVTLDWTAPADQTPTPSGTATPTAGLSYNLRVGTTPGGGDIVGPMSFQNPPSSQDDGLRKIAQRGLVQGTSWTLDDLTPGQTYYWSVQAIDTALAGSPFAAEGSFTPPIFSDISAAIAGVRDSSVSWGDYDNDGDLDILLAGFDSGYNEISRVYQNTSGTFSDISAGLTGVDLSSVAWGDYDNDGDLDILLTGQDDSSNRVSQVYQNTSGTFSDISAGLTGVSDGSVAWGDYDNDGDLDILLTGREDLNNFISRVYQNSSGTFSDITAGLIGVFRSSVAWGDYDNDGDLDVLLTGSNDGNDISRVYQNTSGTFSDISAGLIPVYSSSVAWGDYDNDGDLDVLLTGYSSSGEVLRVYQNTGGTFSDISAGLDGVQDGSVAWGDYDNDGDLDILLTGRDFSTRMSRVYQNNSGTFSDINAGLTGVNYSSVAWGDHDNDGDLDILLTGRDAAGNFISRVYRNNGTTFNSVPAAPSGLNAAQNSPTSITVSWTGSGDAQTTTPGLSYNLRVGTTPGGSDIVGPMSFQNPPSAQADGLRKIAQRGLVQGTSWTLDGLLADQKYYWSVQAIDTALAGSEFAAEGSFVTKSPDQIGVYRDSLPDIKRRFYLDSNADGLWSQVSGGDMLHEWTFGDQPLVGDWDGDGDDDLGVYRDSLPDGHRRFYLDTNGDGVWSKVSGGDTIHVWTIGDQPLVGDWDGDGDDDLGVYRDSLPDGHRRFYLDTNGDGVWSKVSGGDTIRVWTIGDQPLVGDWDGDGDDDLGVYRDSLPDGHRRFYLDTNGDGLWSKVSGGDTIRVWTFGDQPLIGDWDGDGDDDLGVYRELPNGTRRFYQDTNGDGLWSQVSGGDTFDDWTFGDRPLVGNWPAVPALLAAGGPAVADASVAPLANDKLAPIVDAALTRFTAFGASQQQLAALSRVQFAIADLPGSRLGQASGNTITLDANAAGYGWYVDPTPQDDREFIPGSQQSSHASQLRMDLLTAVMHELGHVLGYDHGDDLDAMFETLAIGTRRGL